MPAPSPLLVVLVLGLVPERGVEAQQVPALLHMGRERRADVEGAAGWMRNDDPPRVQVELVLDAAGESPLVLGGEVFGVADDGMADVSRVRTELMGAAGDRAHGQPRQLAAGLVDEGVERYRV